MLYFMEFHRKLPISVVHYTGPLRPQNRTLQSAYIALALAYCLTLHFALLMGDVMSAT